MSVRAKLEAKRRRTCDVPVLVSDPSEDQESLMQAVAALAAARGQEDADSIAILEQAQRDAADKVQQHWAMVLLQSLPPADWEAATAEFQGEDGINWGEALPVLLAVSCVDPDLQDEDWWREQLAKPEWSDGDINALKLGLLQLNVAAVNPTVPKG